MSIAQLIPPPNSRTGRNNDDQPESIRSAVVRLKENDFIFECLSRKWDKRYRFEHPVLGLVIFDESGENLLFTTITYTNEEIKEFKRFVIAWQYQEGQ